MIELMTIHTKAFRMTDEEFVRFCEDNPDLRIERTPDKEIIIMAPTFARTGVIHSIINSKLVKWSLDTKSGVVTDSSTGFHLPDTSMRAPDLAWIPINKWKSFSDEEKNSFLKYCPDFIIEVKSKTDRLKDLQAKMKSWVKNGTRLAWLIDPQEEKIWIYRKNGTIDEVTGFDNTLKGEDVLPDFIFDLKDLRIE